MEARPIIFIGVPAALAGYGIYKIGKLPDHISHESLYVTAALIGGTIVWLKSSHYCFLCGGTKPQTSVPEKIVANVSGAAALAALPYMLTRTVLKQSPKTSLIVSLAIACGYGLYNKLK